MKYKNILNIVKKVIISFITLIVIIVIALQFATVQTFITNVIINKLNTYIDGTISISQIYIKPFKTLYIKNLAIIDNNPYKDQHNKQVDTIFYAQDVSASFSLKGLLQGKGLYLSSVKINNGSFCLTTEPLHNNTTITNLNRVFKFHSDTTKTEPKNIFALQKASITNFRFRLKNYNSYNYAYKLNEAINWADLDCFNINLYAKNISLKKGIMSAVINKLSVKEKSGYIIKSLQASTKVGKGKVIINNLQLKDNLSNITIPSLIMSYENSASWASFVDKVYLDGIIAPSLLNIKSISYFAPSLQHNNFNAYVQGNISGYVNNLHIKQLYVNTLHSNVKMEITGSLQQVTEPSKMQINLTNKNLSFNLHGLSQFIQGWAPSVKLNLKEVGIGQYLQLNGSIEGELNKLKVNQNITTTNNGVAKTNLLISSIIDKENPINISGEASIDNIDVSKFIGKQAIKECSVYTKISANLGKQVSVNIDSLNILKMNALGYNYTDIIAKGKYENNIFDGKVICKDPNLNFLFQGVVTTSALKGQNAIYQFHANVGYADLHALKLDNKNTSKIGFSSQANFLKTPSGELLGQVMFKGINISDERGSHKIGNIKIISHISNKLNRIKLTSKFADISYIGSSFITQFIKDLQALVLQKELSVFNKSKYVIAQENDYNLVASLHNTNDIIGFFAPGVYISDSTDINLNINKNKVLTANIKSNKIAFNDKYVKNIVFNIDNLNNKLTGVLKAKEICFAPIKLQNNIFNISAQKNFITLNVNFNNDKSNNGNILLTTNLYTDEKDSLVIDASIFKSQFLFKSSIWNVNPSKIIIDRHKIDIDKFNISNQRQFINIDGAISKINNKKDSLNIGLKNFDLSVLNGFSNMGLGIQGYASGKANIISPIGAKMGLLLDIKCDSTSLANEKIGQLFLKSTWDDVSQGFKMAISNKLNNIKTFSLVGTFIPSTKEVKGNLYLNGLNLSYAKPFVSSIFSDFRGGLLGNIQFNSKNKKIDINSYNLRINKGYLVVDYTKVPYYVEGGLDINNNGLFFEDLRLTDEYKAKGIVSGGLKWKHFNNIVMDTHIKLFEMEALKLSPKDNPNFYGHIFGSGNVNIVGPFNNLLIDINASTAKDGKFYIPLSNSSNSKESDLLTFKEPSIDGEIIKKSKSINQVHKSNNLEVRIKLNANQATQAIIEMDNSTDNAITGWGNGYIDLDIKPSADVFNINGIYNIAGGNYRFGALGIAYRDFTIQENSTVKFNGNIMDSDLNITALYKTKTNIGILIGDNTSNSKRQVVCGISIKGKIQNPKISFSVNIPNLDPITAAKVQTALSTEDKVQKQFLAVLLINSFLPDEQSGIVNNNNILYSNVSEIMANQLNNILQKFDIPINLGLDYQQNKDGKNAFDVAVSTQLFNSRVSINGTFGNRQYSNKTNQNSEFVGDLDIEIKIDKTGALRLNIFSHSADQYSNYLDNTQRNGVGVTYQREFNKLHTFLKNLFKNNRAIEAIKAVNSEPKQKIEISTN